MDAAESLQIKGISGNKCNAPTTVGNNGQQSENLEMEVPEKYLETPEFKPLEDQAQYDLDISEPNGTKQVQIIEEHPDIDQLNETLSKMMRYEDGGYLCLQCGKRTPGKSFMRNHIEGKHIEGISHPCNQCGKTFRSRNSLRSHISQHHK